MISDVLSLFGGYTWLPVVIIIVLFILSWVFNIRHIGFTGIKRWR
jgi:hypothetical protein